VRGVRECTRRTLQAVREWRSRPFVDTVDTMQGQECDSVIVSYGVSDVEYAMNEKEFIYSLNRLNVSNTRARSKTIVFLPRPRLEPPIQAFEDDHIAPGVAFMQSAVVCDTGAFDRRSTNGGRSRLSSHSCSPFKPWSRTASSRTGSTRPTTCSLPRSYSRLHSSLP
jgi:AAA domain